MSDQQTYGYIRTDVPDSEGIEWFAFPGQPPTTMMVAVTGGQDRHYILVIIDNEPLLQKDGVDEFLPWDKIEAFRVNPVQAKPVEDLDFTVPPPTDIKHKREPNICFPPITASVVDADPREVLDAAMENMRGTINGVCSNEADRQRMHAVIDMIGIEYDRVMLASKQEAQLRESRDGTEQTG